MAYTPTTWVEGVTTLGPTNLNKLETGLQTAAATADVALAGPACRVTNSAATSLTSGALTVLAWDTERYDTDAIHDNVTNNTRLTCKTAGKYAIFASIDFSASATGDRILEVLSLGGNVIARERIKANDTSNTDMTIYTVWNMAVNDYVELRAYQTSGGALNVNVFASYSPEFGMTRIA